MGFFTGMMNVFTGSGDKVLDMASGVGKFIDESFHTEEEKSDAKMKFFELKLRWLNATQGQNLARRYCAMLFGLNFIIAFQACLWMALFGDNPKEKIISVIELAVTFNLGWIMLAIIGFYFGKEMLNKDNLSKFVKPKV